MRKENCYHITVLSVPEALSAQATDIRLIYVLDGHCRATVNEQTTEMAKWDCILVNCMDSVQVHFSAEDVVAVISIDYIMLCEFHNTQNIRFAVNSQQGTGQKYTKLHQQIQSLLMAHVDQQSESAFQEMGLFFLLLHTLLSDFRVHGSESREDEGDLRVAQMIHYIRTNYSTNLTLNEIADRLYLSPSTASRLFQKATGKKFVSYIKDVRLEHVKQQLVSTDSSITRIAADSGFSTPSALNKIFKSEFGITPTEYREQRAQLRQTQPSAEVRSVEMKDRLLHILKKDQQLQSEQRSLCQSIRCDMAQRQPWSRWQNRLLNIGPVHMLSSASVQRHVLFLVEQLEIEYIRVWNLFSPKMMMISESGEYNYTFLDEILDFCVDNHLKLFLDLAQRRDMAMASENREIYSSDEHTAFSSANEWCRALNSLLRHLRRRYHERVVGQWIYEFTFFLNDRPYYLSDTYSTAQVWETGWALVKRNIPSARVAGMGLTSGFSVQQIRESTTRALDMEHRPDIFTMMVFPYALEGGMPEGGIYQNQFKKIASRTFLRDRIELVREILEEGQFQGELWVTDWGNSLANRNYVQDSCFRGTFLLENFLNCMEKVDCLGIFYATDLLNAFSDSNALLSGSAGLLSRNGICKPAFFAYRFLGRLGRDCLVCGENCIITAESENDIRILCFNNKALGPKYYLCEEDTYRPDELNQLFVSNDPLSMDLSIHTQGSNEIYTVRQKVLNEEKGSVLNKWIAFGCSTHLSRSDLRYLERTSTPEITMERMMSTNNTLRISLRLEPNEIRFITIMKE